MAAELAVSSELADLVHEDRVHQRVYTDPAIFRQEMQRIFGRTWVYVAHESEVAANGDYVTRYIGLQPVVVTRDQASRIHVLLNRCRHRGAIVCREARGNSTYFRCLYHGWTYSNEGTLIGVPQRGRYPDSFDLGALGLAAVPRVETYRGLIFACLNPDVESLEVFLGGAKHHVDVMFDWAENGEIDVSCGCNKHEYHGNWKLQAENGADGYHAPFVHESANLVRAALAAHGAEPLAPRAGEAGQLRGWCESYGHGHGVLLHRSEPGAVEKMRQAYPDWVARLATKHPLDESLGLRQNLFIFPNIYIRPDHIRVIQPRAVDHTEVLMYPYRLEGVPEALNLSRLRDQEFRLAVGGNMTPDDMAAFDEVQAGLQAETVDWVYFTRGLHDEVVREDGVRVSVDASDETTMRELYREWKRLMVGEGGP